ncbi:MAG: hypothetical protein ACQEXJ_19755 [Myxococcota bacterium]
MARHARQFYGINARPFGLSLDADISDPDARAAVDAFLASEPGTTFEEATGNHPYELIQRYDEYGDLGFFGGVALAATAYEYMTLRRDGADPERLARARARVVRAAESWHVFYVATGGEGIVARGIRPPSNFDARSAPFKVNGGGGDRLNPGGDLLASYWIARYMQVNAPGETNVSPFARGAHAGRRAGRGAAARGGGDPGRGPRTRPGRWR